MSTVKLVNLQHPSSTAANLTLAADGTVTGGLPAGGRNLLYNGAMQVAQRGTSTASITTVGYYTADRWRTAVNALGTWTQSVETDGPTGSGLTKSLKMLCTTADAAPAAGDYLWVSQRLEGQDLQRIAKGTASAQQLTLSFWVKSNKTGTYVCLLEDQDNNRIVGASYTVSASATWEKKTITFPADTTGAFTNDNGTSMEVFFWLAAGSDYTSGTLPATWAASATANYAPGQTNLAAAINNYWQVTGVQLEVGPVASAFEFKPYGQELRECQRYYYLHVNGVGEIGSGYYRSSTEVQGHVSFPVTMRTAPSGETVSGTGYYSANLDTFNDFTVFANTANVALIYQISNVSGTQGDAVRLTSENAASRLAFGAEL